MIISQARTGGPGFPVCVGHVKRRTLLSVSKNLMDATLYSVCMVQHWGEALVTSMSSLSCLESSRRTGVLSSATAKAVACIGGRISVKEIMTLYQVHLRQSRQNRQPLGCPCSVGKSEPCLTTLDTGSVLQAYTKAYPLRPFVKVHRFSFMLKAPPMGSPDQSCP